MNKINRLTLFAALTAIVSFSTPCFAKEDTRELPIGLVGKGFTVSVSDTDWTRVAGSLPETQLRVGMKVSNPASNSNSVYGVLSNGPTTPTEATTVRPIEIQPRENPFIPVANGMNLWLISPDGAQSVHAQEVKQ